MHVFYGMEYYSADTEEEPSSAKLAWLNALEKYKEQKCEIDENGEPKGDAQLRPEAKTKSIRAKQDKRKALYLSAGQRHSVWTPKQPSLKKSAGFTDVVMQVVKNKQDLLKRQQRLRSRIMATQLVLKEQREEIAECSDDGGEGEQSTMPEKRVKWQSAIKKVIDDNTKAKKKKHSKRSVHFHDVVSRYAATMSTSTQDDSAVQSSKSTNLQDKADARRALRQWRSQYLGDRKQSASRKPPKSVKQSYSTSNLPVKAEVHQHLCQTIPEEGELTQDTCM